MTNKNPASQPTHAIPFNDALKNASQLIPGQAVHAAEKLKKQQFKQDKKLSVHTQNIEESEEDEPIHKTLNEIKKSLHKIIELEKKGLNVKKVILPKDNDEEEID